MNIGERALSAHVASDFVLAANLALEIKMYII